MKHDREPELAPQVVEQPQHLRLHHHVERGGRLVGDQQPRLAGEREPDQHALALAARQLVRVVARAPRRQPDELQQLADARRSRRGRAASCAARSPRRSGAPTRWTGLSECSAPWKTIAMSVQRTARSRPGFIVSTSSPSSSTSPVTLVPLREQPEERARQRGLPAAGLAGQPERVARRELEAHAAHGGHRAAARLIGHVQVADLEQGSCPLVPQPWVQDLLERLPDEREREHDEHDPEAGRDVVPPRLLGQRALRRTPPGASCPTRPASGRRGRGTTASSPTGSPPARSASGSRGSAATRSGGCGAS